MSKIKSDGSLESDSVVFDLESDVDWTRRDKYRSVFRTWVLEPGLVIKNDVRGILGFAIVGMFFLFGTVGVVVYPEPTTSSKFLLPPFQDLQYPLGTQNRGIGILSLIIHSTPNMLRMILSGAMFATFMAAIIGITAGYVGGIVDRVLSVVTDVALAIPGIPLVIALSFIIQPTDPYVVGLVLSVNAWGGRARAIRSQVLTIKRETFVEKSEVLGLSFRTIFLKDIIPGLLPYILVGFVNMSRIVIFNSVGLYFLGVLPFTHKNWGVMINLAFEENVIYSISQVHWLLVPLFTVILITLGFMLLAQSLDKVFNPRARTRHAGESIQLEE